MADGRTGAIRSGAWGSGLSHVAAAPTEADLRSRVAELFRPGSATRSCPGNVGVEVEVIPVSLADGCRVPPQADAGLALDPVLRQLATEGGWTAGTSPAGAPNYTLPHGGRLSWEPGGQLEYSTLPMPNLDRLTEDAASIMNSVARAARAHDIGLLARGIDPVTQVGDTRMVLEAERYMRMTDHYNRSGPHGIQMMRLTAGIHVNLDLGANPLARWSAANRIVPALMAAFANAPVCAASAAPARSHRAAQWRHLDPSRTGCFDSGGDPVEAYAEFALNAQAFLLGHTGSPARPFRDWIGQVGMTEWEQHLTTLFPEVRPRGYLELRFFDALPAQLYGLPVAAVAGLLMDAENTEWINRSLPAADRDRLVRAGREGLGDATLRREAVDLLGRAAAGLERLGPAHASQAMVRRLRAYTGHWVAAGRDPGSDAASMVDDPGQ